MAVGHIQRLMAPRHSAQAWCAPAVGRLPGVCSVTGGHWPQQPGPVVHHLHSGMCRVDGRGPPRDVPVLCSQGLSQDRPVKPLPASPGWVAPRSLLSLRSSASSFLRRDHGLVSHPCLLRAAVGGTAP